MKVWGTKNYPGMAKDARIPKILFKATNGMKTKNVKKSEKDENEKHGILAGLKELEQKSKHALNILNELNTICDTRLDSAGEFLKNGNQFGQKKEKNSAVLTEGIKDIQKKNKKIRSILDAMSNDSENKKGLVPVNELENVFHKE